MKKLILSVFGLATLTCSTWAQQFSSETEAKAYYYAQDPNNYEQLVADNFSTNSGIQPSQSMGGGCTYATYDQNDGVTWGYTDITGTGTLAVASGDDVAAVVTLGASFTFYGTTYTELEATSNGVIASGTGSAGDYSNDCPIPSSPSTGAGARIYPFHDDLEAAVYYQYDAVALYPHPAGLSLGASVFQWSGSHLSGGAIDFQCVLYDNGDILYLYNVEPEGGSGATIGVQNDGATLATTYACNTASSITPGVTAVFITENLYVSIGGDQSECAGVDVTFDATAVFGTPTIYSWSTGGSASSETVAAATQTVTLTVTDANGCTGSASADLTALDCYCDESQGTAGFPSDPTCEAAVCAIDDFCCSSSWDGICASEAALLPECSSCWAPPAAYCDAPQGTAGFPSDAACESAVCAIDGFCCDTEWDGICASEAAVEAACASCLCDADAGTITADASPVCLSGGSAVLSATTAGDQVLPTYYVETYILVQGGLIVEVYDVLNNGTGSPSFTVNAAGGYSIHTLVYQPSSMDFSLLDVGDAVSSLDAYFIQGGGDVCGSLDLVGAEFTVNEVTATVSGGGLSCDGNPVAIQADFTGVGPWDVIVDVDGTQVPQTGLSTPTVIPVTDAGTYTIVSVLDQGTGCTGVGTGSAVVTVGSTTVADFTYAPVGGSTGVAFTDASTENPTSWLWDFGDGNTSTQQNPTHTYAAAGVYDVCVTATNDCGTDSACVSSILVSPSNDLCADAESILCGTSVIGSTEFATSTGASDCQSTGLGLWYSFVGDGNQVIISTDNAGTDFDTYLGVTETCGGSCFDSDDDGGSGLTSEISFTTVNGQTYYIQVSSYNGTITGNFELSLECILPPSNDDECSPEALSIGTNGPFTNAGATAEAYEADLPTVGCDEQGGWCVDPEVENSIWFTFVAPASGNVIVDTDGSTFDTQLAVFEASSCQDFANSTATLLGANDDAGAGLQSLVILCGLTPGNTYYVLVDGYNGAVGDATVTITETTVDADFSYVATFLSVEFTDASTSSSSITDWSWDFGDGNTSTDASPTHAYATDGTYTVCLEVTDENGCTSEYCEPVQVVDMPTSIAEAVENGMAVYPNPSNGEFTVEINGVEADVQLVVLDVTGRVVYTEGVVLNGSFRRTMNVDVASGTYFLQIATAEGLVTRKLQIH